MSFAPALLRSLACSLPPLVAAALITAPAIAQTASSTPGSIVPMVLCSEYNPSTGEVSKLLLGENRSSSDQVIVVSPQNFFSPGIPNQGQPVYYPVGLSDLFVGSYTPVAATDSLDWSISGNVLVLTGAGTPCTVPYLHPAALSVPGSGTFTHLLLGSVEHPGFSPTAQVLPVQANAPVSVTNIQLIPAPSDPNSTVATASLAPNLIYGDVTVSPGAAGTYPLLLTLGTQGLQTGTAVSSLTVAPNSAATTGCPTNITQSVAGSMTNAVPFFATNFYTQTVTIKNTTQTTLSGPIEVALTNLSPNARLLTAGGTGTCPGIAGAPFVPIAHDLAPGANAAVVLTFANSGSPSLAITYTPVIVSGGQRF